MSYRDLETIYYEDITKYDENGYYSKTEVMSTLDSIESEIKSILDLFRIRTIDDISQIAEAKDRLEELHDKLY